MNPYRTPAPPDPPPTWWERYGQRVVTAIYTIAGIVCVSLFATCLIAFDKLRADERAAVVRQFEQRVAECPIVEVDRGKREDPVMVTLQCPTYRERRQVPPGARIP